MSTIPFLKGLLEKLPLITKLNQSKGCPLLGVSLSDSEVSKQENTKAAKVPPTRNEVESFFGG